MKTDQFVSRRRQLAASFQGVADSIPQLKRGKLWCFICGRVSTFQTGGCLQRGWEKCCGETMSIDSPEEREALAKRAKGSD